MPQTLAQAACFALALSFTRCLFGQCEPISIDPPLPWAEGEFASAIAVGGADALLVGDRAAYTACGGPEFCRTGVVYVFTRLGGGAWQESQRITSADPMTGDAFGRSVTVSRDRMLVGATGVDSGGFGAGAAYIFELSGGAWAERAELLPPIAEFGSAFGEAGALVDDWAFVGARSITASPGVSRAGAVFVYRREGGQWQFVQTLTAPDPLNQMQFGGALAADGDTLVVGARFSAAQGAAYVYKLDGGRWEFEALLSADPPASTAIGASVAIEGDLIIAGAPADSDPKRGAGAVYVFERNGGNWRQAARLQHADAGLDDHLGAAVAMEDGIIFAGAGEYEWASGEGAVFIFKRDGSGAWRQIDALAPPPFTGYEFGESIAVGGGMLAVGDKDQWIGAFESAGRAYTFDLGCLLCRADLDGDGELTFFDFITFGNFFAAGDMTADFDGSGTLDFFDFLAFQNEFAAGCA